MRERKPAYRKIRRQWTESEIRDIVKNELAKKRLAAVTRQDLMDIYYKLGALETMPRIRSTQPADKPKYDGNEDQDKNPADQLTDYSNAVYDEFGLKISNGRRN